MMISKKEKELPHILFLPVFLLLSAFILSNTIFHNSSMLLPLMSGFYVINILLLVLYALKTKTTIKKKFLLLPAISLFISLCTIISCSIYNIQIQTYDLINVLIKAVNLFCYIILFINIKINKNQFLYLMKLFVILGVAACIYNFIFNFYDILNFYKITSTYDLSLNSIFSNRNQFGAYLFLATVAYNFYNDRKKITAKNYVIYGLFILNIILTMSRGAILATGIFVILILLYNKKYKTIIFLLILAILLAIIVNQYFPIFKFISDNILRTDTGTTGRTKIWATALSIWKNGSIMFGTGYYSGLEIAKTSYAFKYSQFHSYYCDLLVEGGIAQLLFISIIIFLCYRNSQKCKDIYLKRTMTASFISILVFSFFESVNFLALGYADMLYTIFYMTVPILLSNIKNNNYGGEFYVCN